MSADSLDLDELPLGRVVYVHGIRAGSMGSRGLDITTRIKPKRSGVPYLRLEKAVPGSAYTFDAVWTDLQGMKGQATAVPGLIYS